MRPEGNNSPMTPEQVIDQYFIENRTKMLDLAAFLDRLDRAGGQAKDDFRMTAFRDALRVLAAGKPARVLQIQTIFSDPTTEPLDVLDQKSARGAYDSASREGAS